MKKRGGFTLLELIIVIAILALLAGGIIPLFTTVKDDSAIAKAKAEMENMRKAAQLMSLDTNMQVPNTCCGSGLADNCMNCDCTGTIPDWQGPYLDNWHDDPWGNQYCIFKSEDTLYIKSNGPDVKPSGPDNIILMITPW